MESFIDIIFSNTLYSAITFIIALLLIYAIIKKVVKLIFSVGIILVIYAVYLNYTKQKIPGSVDELKNSVSDNLEIVKESASKSYEEVKETTIDIIEDKVEEKLDNILK